jgi:hypothetical protein
MITKYHALLQGYSEHGNSKVLKTTDTVGVTKNRDHYNMELNVPEVNFGCQVFPSTENLTTCILDISEVVLHCGYVDGITLGYTFWMFIIILESKSWLTY